MPPLRAGRRRARREGGRSDGSLHTQYRSLDPNPEPSNPIGPGGGGPGRRPLTRFLISSNQDLHRRADDGGRVVSASPLLALGRDPTRRRTSPRCVDLDAWDRARRRKGLRARLARAGSPETGRARRERPPDRVDRRRDLRRVGSRGRDAPRRAPAHLRARLHRDVPHPGRRGQDCEHAVPVRSLLHRRRCLRSQRATSDRIAAPRTVRRRDDRRAARDRRRGARRRTTGRLDPRGAQGMLS